MIFKRQLFFALSALLLTLLCQQTHAQMLTSDDNTISNLYENLLQREYAGPEIFPSHQVERKAQRSPSLRLRFGRSMDSPMGQRNERQGGDVDQKPIRSPSLRLRWGRSVPYEAAEASDAEENVQRQRSDEYLNYLMNAQKLRNILMAMHQYDVDNAEDASDEFEREVRKPGPLRLRWGRSTDGRNSAGMAEKEALQKAAATQTENVKE